MPAGSYFKAPKERVQGPGAVRNASIKFAKSVGNRTTSEGFVEYLVELTKLLKLSLIPSLLDAFQEYLVRSAAG